MKALIFFYLLVKLYIVYYSACMIYRLLCDDAIPLFVAFGLLFVIKWGINVVKIKRM